MPTNIRKYILTNFVTEEHHKHKKKKDKRKREKDFVEVAMKKTHLSREKIQKALNKGIVDEDPVPFNSKQRKDHKGRFTSGKTILDTDFRSSTLVPNKEEDIPVLIESMRPIVMNIGLLSIFYRPQGDTNKDGLACKYIGIRTKGTCQIDLIFDQHAKHAKAKQIRHAAIETITTVKSILTNLMINAYDFVLQHLPNEQQIGFRNAYRSKLPHNVFLNYYPPHIVKDDNPRHIDNANYATVVIQLTKNSDTALSMWTIGVKKELNLQQGEAVILFRGVEHQVRWANKTTERISLVLFF